MQSNQISCSIEGCNTPAKARGWCKLHYRRLMYGASSDPGTFEKRFWTKVDKSDGCWLWQGSIVHNGYGRFWKDNRPQYAHRIAFELTGNTIPDGLMLDHRCHNRACVRPSHLRVVTEKQNHEHRSPKSTGRSGLKNVYQFPDNARWMVTVTHNGKRHYGGTFADKTRAAEAARALRNKLFTHNDLDRHGDDYKSLL